MNDWTLPGLLDKFRSEAAMPNVPGIKARHAVITDDCRKGRTEQGAWDEAVRRLEAEYHAICEALPVGQGARFHLVLTLEPPQRTAAA